MAQLVFFLSSNSFVRVNNVIQNTPEILVYVGNIIGYNVCMTSQNFPNDDQPKLDDLLSLSEAAEYSGLSATHLRLLVRNGDLQGRKIGRDWVTTKLAIDQYLSKERKRGPKPSSEA
jgi:excisionase family DNA binding protein